MTIDIEDWAVIVHEAGHLTVASRLGLDVRKVELVWENGWLNGYSHVVQGSKLSDYLVVVLSGEVSEVEIFGKQVLPRVHARSDREQLYRSVVHHGPAGELAHVVAKQTVVRLVHVHRGAILQLSHDLLTLVHHAQGAAVSVEGDELVRLLGGPDVAILRLAANG